MSDADHCAIVPHIVLVLYPVIEVVDVEVNYQAMTKIGLDVHVFTVARIAAVRLIGNSNQTHNHPM